MQLFTKRSTQHHVADYCNNVNSHMIKKGKIHLNKLFEYLPGFRMTKLYNKDITRPKV